MSPTISPTPIGPATINPVQPSAAAGVGPAPVALADRPGIGPGAASEADLIPLLRTQIDAIDAGIARLIAERARLSRRIQTARIAAGGVRVELGRERRILEAYRTALGGEGTALATAVLRLCRGPL